ncbi:general amino-acid permease GAP1 [Blumeria hordei DH14]|uniref:General amino-acid permease GAP1 n=1 Tax=Blumeria graminis f. sp. hordei (strain DH14) TaxID=546991 RepID=N1JCP3_BLUG1|nr:general amino-acid permease GAP1 [Blumeria hordei DH14]
MRSPSYPFADPLLSNPKAIHGTPTTGDAVYPSRVSSRQYVPAMGEERRVFNAEAAAWCTANSPLARRLKGRHIQMIAVGGSIGTGLFIDSGAALAAGGPAFLLIAFIILGAVLFCVVQALGELAVTFPVAGSYSAFATRFIDPAWGFAFSWNYALQWAFTFPLEIISAAITLEYWNCPIPSWLAVAIFLAIIVGINLFSVKVYGEVEYMFSVLKLAAVIGFIILGVLINCAGTQDSGYIGARYWHNPGAFNNGFKGFCGMLITATFSYAGTELVALGAAETQNPSKTLPTAIKQVFWRVATLYIASVMIIGLLIPYNSPKLVLHNSMDPRASPFIIAIRSAGIHGLDTVMNVVVLITVLSVANSSMYSASRVFSALGEQGQAPRFMAYVDQSGRPLVSIGVVSIFGLSAFLYVTPICDVAFSWLLAISSLSTIFTWASICYTHILFRRAWAYQGLQVSDLIYRSPIGAKGSYAALVALLLILIAHFWVLISPCSNATQKPRERLIKFIGALLAIPLILILYFGYKICYRTRCVRMNEVDLVTGRNGWEGELQRRARIEDRREWPRWKVIYRTLC